MKYMKIAISEANKAFLDNEVPVGAIIVKNDKIIARSHNKIEAMNDPTAHAEILAIKEASRELNNWRLNGCEMYVTVEPCLMCMGAIIQSRISKLYFGIFEKNYGAVESTVDILRHPIYKNRLEIYSGICEEASKNLMVKFFNNLR